jgi:hypothetical protein
MIGFVSLGQRDERWGRHDGGGSIGEERPSDYRRQRQLECRIKITDENERYSARYDKRHAHDGAISQNKIRKSG